MWCSNDYLAMGQNKALQAEMLDAISQYGVGAGGTRNISGNSHALVNSEKQADLHQGSSFGFFFGLCC